MNTTPIETDLSLQAPLLNAAPGAKYAPVTRQWQGIPGIERTANGRLWAVWYSGGKGEGPDNYVVLVSSDDDGLTWSEPKVVIDPPGKVRAFDPTLWMDPLGRFWLFWAQSYEWFDGRCGVWAAVSSNPDAPRPEWSAPRRLANGVMMNKPVALSNGEWLIPCAVWARTGAIYDRVRREDMAKERFSNVYVSTDKGVSWHLRGGADVPGRTFDEHMVAERADHSLLMFVRTAQGIGQSVSTDNGRTWEPGAMTRFAGPDSRPHLRRLKSGKLLVIYHDSPKIRRRLAAWVSGDDGTSWSGPLILDERDNVSYPDSVQAPDGRIFAIYDRERYGAGEIIVRVFREEDVLAGKCASGGAPPALVVSRLSPKNIPPR